MHTRLGNTNSNVLCGKTFISTRPAGKSEKLAKLLAASQAKLLSYPMIEIVPAMLTEQEFKHFEEMETFDWVILTSINAVHFFINTGSEISDFEHKIKNVRFAAVGSKTADALQTCGINPHFVGEEATGASLVNGLLNVLKGQHSKILYPTSNLTTGYIPHALQQVATVYKIAIYQTVAPKTDHTKMLSVLQNNAYDIIYFFSPSAFHNFHNVVAKQVPLQQLKVASIGPTTYDAICNAGLTPVFSAQEHTEEGLYAETLAYFSKNEGHKIE